MACRGRGCVLLQPTNPSLGRIQSPHFCSNDSRAPPDENLPVHRTRWMHLFHSSPRCSVEQTVQGQNSQQLRPLDGRRALSFHFSEFLLSVREVVSNNRRVSNKRRGNSLKTKVSINASAFIRTFTVYHETFFLRFFSIFFTRLFQKNSKNIYWSEKYQRYFFITQLSSYKSEHQFFFQRKIQPDSLFFSSLDKKFNSPSSKILFSKNFLPKDFFPSFCFLTSHGPSVRKFLFYSCNAFFAFSRQHQRSISIQSANS